ncbi:MAG: 2-phospho-L-lactate guanylyltransferase [Acidimicrobiia bacterium]
MPVAAIIPIRSFARGKERLASALDPGTRHMLATSMAARTVMAAEAAQLIPAIVTADSGVSSWATSLGVPVIEESGGGLNGAATDGVHWAAANSMRWVVLHADLPLVTGSDLDGIGAAIEGGTAILAPSADGGTTALSSPHPIEFRYGAVSAHLHLAQMGNAEIFARTGLLHDLDSLSDLQSAMEHPEGQWLRSLI